MGELMALFGSWLPWLFGVGAFLLIGGLLTKELAKGSSAGRLGRGAISAGLRMMLLAATIYVLIQGLGGVFNNFISNLPGT
jgi:hypothetical protein